MKTCLTIAGSDCSGGAGIQADLKTFAAHGVYGMSVIVSVVAENTCEVRSAMSVSDNVIQDQMDCIFEDIYPDAIKIGMLPNKSCMKVVKERLSFHQAKNVIIDPVMVAKDGTYLMEEAAVVYFKEHMIAQATLLTPNIPEAIVLTNQKIATENDMRKAAHQLYLEHGCAVLLKGGHFEGEAIDILFDGRTYHRFESKRILSKNTHGTGCTLSSAIASHRALGYSLVDSVKGAKNYIDMVISHGLDLGKGNGPTHHFYELYQNGLTATTRDQVIK